MAAFTLEQKKEHFDYFVKNLTFETVLLGLFGEELVRAIVDHVGPPNFFRSYKNIREGNNYRAFAALKDAPRAAIFVNNNTEIVKVALKRLTIKMSGLHAKEVLTKAIIDGTLKGAPYSLESLQAFIGEGDDYKGDDAQGIQDWFNNYITEMNDALIAHQTCLAVYGVTKEQHDSNMVKKALYDGDTSSAAYPAFCLSLVKTITIMTAETFENYLSKQD